MGHKQLSSEVREDVSLTAVGSPTAPEEAGGLSPRRNWQKPRENGWILKAITPKGQSLALCFFTECGRAQQVVSVRQR